MEQSIAILDFGSQYTQVIARRVREAHVYCEILPFNTPASVLSTRGFSGIILSGGPSSVLAESSPRPDADVFALGVPVLGICYGIQLLAYMLGGKVAKSLHREYGHGSLIIHDEGALFRGLKGPLKVWNSHGDRLEALPKGFHAIAHTENSEYAAIEDSDRHFYGIQFHPEVAHTESGSVILQNFIFNICGCRGDWVMEKVMEASVARIHEEVGEAKVILGLSGGVDSSVAAALIHRAIGNRLTCVFVDNGLLRHNERAEVEQLFGDHFSMDLRVVDAGERFLHALKGVTDPEQKRKIIGKIFVDVFDEAVHQIGDVKFLAQGTLYSDVIESVSIDGNPASLIKSHHNVGGLPEKMNLKLLEPLRELFKDEVRVLGESLGLPHHLLWRHPFPGPGLGIRVMGEITEDRLRLLRQAEQVLLEEMRSSGYYERVWQSFCVFLPVKSVGVMGDERTYEYTIALRIVESKDAMTADWARLPYDLLQVISSRIINEVSGVNRVVLDISSKPPSTIEWE